jgi:hypothetical protein
MIRQSPHVLWRRGDGDVSGGRESVIRAARPGIARPLVLATVAGLALALWLAPWAHAAADFLPPKAYPAGDTPEGVVVGDLNADGDPDLAVPNGAPGTVSVLRGQAGGGFGGPTPYPAGGSPNSIATDDFNADGDPDLVVTHYASGTLSVLLGAAGGGFRAPTSYAAGSYPASVVADDFSGDGDPDLAIVNVHSQSVSVLPGEAGGGFGAWTAYAVGNLPVGLTVGEFSGDTDPDLFVANAASDNVSVLPGVAGAGFGAQTTYRAGDGPEDIAVADYNGDDDPDLAVANGNSDNVSVLPGLPGAGFGAQTTYRAGNAAWKIAAADFNADGDPDLAVANLSGSLSVLSGGPGAGFGAQVVYPLGGSPYDVAVGDFNADDDPDLAAPEYSSDSVSVLLGTPLDFSPASVDFGSQPDSTERARTVTLENRSGRDVAVTQVALGGMDLSSFGIRDGDDGCTGATVPNGGTCAVKVRFHPDGVGLKSARLRFTDDAVTSPQTVELSGTGIPGPWLTPSAQGLKFGRVQVGTTTATKQVTLTNTGSAPMQISSIVLEGANPGDFVGFSESCTALASLGPDESCSAQIAFRPTAAGSRTAKLNITDTAPGSPHYIQLGGTGN